MRKKKATLTKKTPVKPLPKNKVSAEDRAKIWEIMGLNLDEIDPIEENILEDKVPEEPAPEPVEAEYDYDDLLL